MEGNDFECYSLTWKRLWPCVRYETRRILFVPVYSLRRTALILSLTATLPLCFDCCSSVKWQNKDCWCSSVYVSVPYELMGNKQQMHCFMVTKSSYMLCHYSTLHVTSVIRNALAIVQSILFLNVTLLYIHFDHKLIFCVYGGITYIFWILSFCLHNFFFIQNQKI